MASELPLIHLMRARPPFVIECVGCIECVEWSSNACQAFPTNIPAELYPLEGNPIHRRIGAVEGVL